MVLKGAVLFFIAQNKINMEKAMTSLMLQFFLLLKASFLFHKGGRYMSYADEVIEQAVKENHDEECFIRMSKNFSIHSVL